MLGFVIRANLPTVGVGYFVNRYGDLFSIRMRNLSGDIGPNKLRQSIKRNGYKAVVLHNGDGKTTTLVHSLICSAFHGPRPPKCEVRHLDGDKTNNRAENLCWGTKVQNAEDTIRLGRQARGEGQSQHKLTNGAVLDVRHRWPNETIASLAREYAVGESTIRRVVQGTHWRHVVEEG